MLILSTRIRSSSGKRKLRSAYDIQFKSDDSQAFSSKRRRSGCNTSHELKPENRFPAAARAEIACATEKKCQRRPRKSVALWLRDAVTHRDTILPSLLPSELPCRAASERQERAGD